MLRASEQELRDQARRLQEIHQRQNDFLATLGHELRDPLTSVRNAVDLLKTGPEELAPTELRRIRDILDRQVSQLTYLVNDLLDTARITQGRIQLQKSRVLLADVVAQAVETIQPLIQKRGHELTVSLPASPVWLEVDAIRLVQVISLLLDNAAQYMLKAGPIWLLAELEGAEVAVKIIDRGKGISAHMLPHVFELFSQAKHPLHSPPGNLGLGLVLVRKLVEMHGGVVSAFSDGPDKGSQFIVRLATVSPEQPVQPTEEPVQPMASAPSRRRVLIVDDNKDLADSLTLLLRRHGHTVQTVYDGESALDAIAAFKPEVVFLDIGLPGMDGFQVAQQLRLNPHRKNMRVVALTGYGQEEDIQRISAAGFDRHLVKPVKIKALQEALAV
jgi:two-component system CheB/CheR fusion protein